MKIKKLLSIGALAVVLASSLSIGASAATTTDGLSAKTKDLIKVLAKNQYQNGKNQTDLFSGVSKDSKIGSVSNDAVITEINSQIALKYTTDSAVSIDLAKAEDKFAKDKDKDSFYDVLKKVTTDEDTFNKFKKYFALAAGKLETAESQSDAYRTYYEKEFIKVVSIYNNNLHVSFGKDGLGKTSVTLIEGTKLIGEVNEDEVQKAINEVNNLTFAQAKADADYLNSAN